MAGITGAVVCVSAPGTATERERTACVQKHLEHPGSKRLCLLPRWQHTTVLARALPQENNWNRPAQEHVSKTGCHYLATEHSVAECLGMQLRTLPAVRHG